MSAVFLAVVLGALQPVLVNGAVTSLDGPWEVRLSESEGEWLPVRVPGNLPFQGIHYDGVVWLRREVTIADVTTDAALRVPFTSNAYEVFINGHRVGGRGRIGPDGSLVEKDFRAQVYRLPHELLRAEGTNVVALRLRTFYGDGGVMAPGTIIGPEQLVRDAHDRSMAWFAMLVSLFVFAAFFHLVLFYGRAREKHYLSFAVLALALASITAGINTLGYLVSNNPDFNAYLVFIPLIILPVSFVVFFGDFFGRRVVRLRRAMTAIATASILALLASSFHHPIFPFIEGVVLPLSALLLGLALILVIYWTVLAVSEKQPGARAVMSGLVVYALTGVFELLWTFALIPVRVDSNLGFAFFTGAMVVAIASRFDWLHRQAELGERDVLTGCYTRRAFLDKAERLMAQRPAASCIMFDLDHFKRVNDDHGHAMGDRVLRVAGQIVRRAVRADDLVTRWGGEEFLVLLPDQSSSNAEEVAGRIQRALKDERLDDLSITASFGVATRLEGEDLEPLFARADKALYAAKNAGRDCIRRAA